MLLGEETEMPSIADRTATVTRMSEWLESKSEKKKKKRSKSREPSESELNPSPRRAQPVDNPESSLRSPSRSARARGKKLTLQDLEASAPKGAINV